MEEKKSSRNFGLALSGGGFRATLYHLGVVRYLRDSGLLRDVSTITTVSGGSIIGAHMTLNWDRYLGTEEEFQQVSDELIKFMRMDVRNRIVRRFPIFAVLNFFRQLFLQGSERSHTRAGLLEQHYQEFLFGDVGLVELPETPRLYILATNLSEGSLCAFSREGLLLQKRSRSGEFLDMHSIQVGLATIPMAVAASSAFPGFFPPLELTSKDVGATEGEFPPHSFTDGGIYDNLGLRMFRYLKESGLKTDQKYTSEDKTEAEGIDTIFVSNAGATFKVRTGNRENGLLRTAIRSTDILMDRVNQLELETLLDTTGVIFFPITRIVKKNQDPTAINPEVQRQTALIRTDLDCFSELEIRSLVKHGYCVARQITFESGVISADEISTGHPWEPVSSKHKQEVLEKSPKHNTSILQTARILQKSAERRIMRTLFSVRDWPTYFWIPLIFIIFVTVPSFYFKLHTTAIQQRQVLTAVARSSPLYRDVLDMIQKKESPNIPPIEFEEINSVEPVDFTGYDVITDDRIYDLRGWTSSKRPEYPALMHARFLVMKNDQSKERPILRIHLPSRQDAMRAEYLPPSLQPIHQRATLDDGLHIYQTMLDFSKVPVNTETPLVVRQIMPEYMAMQEFNMGRFKFTIAAKTGLVRIWVLLPHGRPHDQFELYRSPLYQPEITEVVEATTTVEVPMGAIATFELINPESNYRYECRWRWLDNDNQD